MAESFTKGIDELTCQILHLRAEMGSEFSAVRGEVRASTDGLRSQLLDEIGKMYALTMKQIIDLGDRVDAGFAGIAGMRAEVRTFREDTLAGLKTIQDRLPPAASGRC